MEKSLDFPWINKGKMTENRGKYSKKSWKNHFEIKGNYQKIMEKSRKNHGKFTEKIMEK